MMDTRRYHLFGRQLVARGEILVGVPGPKLSGRPNIVRNKHQRRNGPGGGQVLAAVSHSGVAVT